MANQQLKPEEIATKSFSRNINSDWRCDSRFENDRCPKLFLSAIASAALTIYWL